MYCYKCGEQVGSDCGACPRCGTAVVPYTGNPPEQNPPPQELVPQNAPKGTSPAKKVCGIIGFASSMESVVCAAALAFFIVFIRALTGPGGTNFFVGVLFYLPLALSVIAVSLVVGVIGIVFSAIGVGTKGKIKKYAIAGLVISCVIVLSTAIFLGIVFGL